MDEELPWGPRKNSIEYILFFWTSWFEFCHPSRSFIDKKSEFEFFRLKSEKGLSPYFSSNSSTTYVECSSYKPRENFLSDVGKKFSKFPRTLSKKFLILFRWICRLQSSDTCWNFRQKFRVFPSIFQEGSEKLFHKKMTR